MKLHFFKGIGICLTAAILLLSISACSQTPSDPIEKADTESEEAAVIEFKSDDYYQTLQNCVSQIRSISDFVPEVVLVLGSGLGQYAEQLDIAATIPYSDIEGWPDSTVAGHKGNLIFATYQGLKIAVMQGRIHYYEGYDIQDVVTPLRVLHLLGADTVILTNAVGAINTDYQVGDFVAIEDHISSFVPSPLIGENIDELGERFTGMTCVYDKALRDAVLQIGKEENITVHSGVFLQTTGPQFETPAEIKMYRQLGADTVGMSSAIEAIAGVHMGMRVCMINYVTNMAAGITGEQISDHEVKENAGQSSKEFSTLITRLLEKIAEEHTKESNH